MALLTLLYISLQALQHAPLCLCRPNELQTIVRNQERFHLSPRWELSAPRIYIRRLLCSQHAEPQTAPSHHLTSAVFTQFPMALINRSCSLSHCVCVCVCICLFVPPFIFLPFIPTTAHPPSSQTPTAPTPPHPTLGPLQLASHHSTQL